MNFVIGQIVTVKTRWKSPILAHDGQFVEHVYTGTVVPNYKWDNEDYVSIKTDNEFHPVSVILKNKITGYELSAERTRQRIFKVTSKSSGKHYNVISSNGKITCDCVGFQFRRKCKHTDKVLTLLLKNNI